MKLATVAEMRVIDRRALEEYGLPELSLMENAGYQAALALEELLGGVKGKSIAVLAGSGNNGGDALTAARHLASKGAKLKIFLTGSPDHYTGSMRVQKIIVEQMELEIQSLEGERSLDRLLVYLKRFADGVLDGIVGTGFTGEPKPELAKLIATVNEAGKPVVAIDIPSGVNADTGAVGSGGAIEAKATIALGLPKAGHFFSPGAEHTGKLLVDDIGIPAGLLWDEEIKQDLLDEELAATLIPPRPLGSHKGSCGRILIVAGSPGFTGAAAMASEAALRAGAGLVTLATGESQQMLLANKLTEVMTAPLTEVSPGVVGGDRALGTLLELADKADGVLIGPGLGREYETKELVRQFLSHLRCPAVLDADALYAFGKKRSLLKDLQERPILTPHLGELAAMLEIAVPELKADLLNIARKTAAECGAVLVVKSECTLVVYPEGQVFFSTKGNPGMATAGSGDVLAGTIAGLLGQTKLEYAPLAGVYLHGLAGDLAYERFAEGLIATDITKHLPLARKKMSGCCP